MGKDVNKLRGMYIQYVVILSESTHCSRVGDWPSE